MINRLVFVFFFTFSLIVAQSDLQNGIRYYNQRHEGCVEDEADPKPISQAISHFEKALADQKVKDIIKNVRNFNPNILIAVGGGCTLDYAKIVSISSNVDKFDMDFLSLVLLQLEIVITKNMIFIFCI